MTRKMSITNIYKNQSRKMSFRYICLLCTILHGFVECKTHRNIHHKDHLRGIYRELYGQPERLFDRWDKKAEEALGYPSGDKKKLAQIANLWSDYYECTYSLVAKVTSVGRLPSAIRKVYAGSVCRLPCGLCIAPDEMNHLVWSFTKSSKNLTFIPLSEDHRYVRGIDGNLTIYDVRLSDSGLYNCRIGKSISGSVILEVLDDEDYIIVKPSSSLGPYPVPSQSVAGLKIFTSWSEWSQCSQCGLVGIRRRYGLCYVRAELYKRKSNVTPYARYFDNGLFIDDLTKLLKDFPEGIPCASEYLPRRIREMIVVQRRRNEIMIGMCKVRCEESDHDGESVEVTDQMTLPTRIITFATIEQSLMVRCPGTTLRDTPIIWRVGGKQITTHLIRKTNQEVVHVNARDHLIFTKVIFADANLYSCWQRDRLVGTVKLIMCSGKITCCNRYTALLALVIAAGVMLRYAERTLRNTQRRLGIT